MSKNAKENKLFMLMSFWGIIMVVDCHTGNTLNMAGRIFPYNSFFIPMFMFISGYFFKPQISQTTNHIVIDICRLLFYNFKRIMVPYYLYNFIFGFLAECMNSIGFTLGAVKITLWSLFVEPFTSGIQFVFNGPAWFVPMLFLVRVLYGIGYILVTKLINKKKISFVINNVVLMIAFFSLEYCVFVAQKSQYGYGTHYSNFDMKLMLIKIGFLIPFYHLGRCFRLYYEEHLKQVDAFIRLLIFSGANLVCIAAIRGEISHIEFGR